jgi:hypothetical protein
MGHWLSRRLRVERHGLHTGRAAVLLILLAGCGGGVPKTPPVDTARAEETLKRALDGWKQGRTPDSFQKDDPPVTVIDVDWMQGSKLNDYALAGEGKTAGGNLVIPVKLTVQDPQGSATEKTITYLVTTSPTLTVTRDLLQ